MNCGARSTSFSSTITSDLSHAATISIAKETNQAAETVIHDNLKKMWARLPASSRLNAVWFINQDVEPALDDLAKVIGTGGVEPNYVTYGPTGVLRIKAAPVVAIEYASTLGTVGDIVLADLSQYIVAEKDMIAAVSVHVGFLTDESAFRFVVRTDGMPSMLRPITPHDGGATRSAYVTLAERT